MFEHERVAEIVEKYENENPKGSEKGVWESFKDTGKFV